MAGRSVAAKRVEAAGVGEVLVGAAHHDAFARLAGPEQMHRGDAARVQPIARKAQRRPVAVLQAQDGAVEVLGAFEIGGFDGVVLQGSQRHGRGSSDKSKIGIGAQHPGADGFEMGQPTLQLLRDRVDVAKASLQRVAAEDERWRRRR
jgi:hypothetical protein